MMIFFVLLTALMTLVVVLDSTRYLIPNWLVALVVALYPAMVLLHGGWPTHSVDWMMALAAAAVMFVLGFALFALKLMGGGDVKLLAACSLWTGITVLADFVIWTALYGGALTLLLLLSRPVAAHLFKQKAEAKTLPRLFTRGAAVPYGLAIAAAFLMLLWQQKLPGLTLS